MGSQSDSWEGGHVYGIDGRSGGGAEPARSQTDWKSSGTARTSRPLLPRSEAQTPTGSPLAWGEVPATTPPRARNARSSGPSNPGPAERIVHRARPATVEPAARRPAPATTQQTSAASRRRFGRIDPFCWFAVTALVILAGAFAFYAESLRATLIVVAFTIALIVFDMWVNRPGETDSFS